MSGSSDRQGCSVRGAPAPATCHIAGLIASDSSICTYPRDKRAVHGGREKGTGERDEQEHPGTAVGCGMLAASLVPRSTSRSHRGENWPLSPKAHRCTTLGCKRRGVSMQRGVQPEATKGRELEGLLCPLPTLKLCCGSVPSSPRALAHTEHPLPSSRSCRPCAGSALASISPQIHLQACRVLYANSQCSSSVSQTPQKRQDRPQRCKSFLCGCEDCGLCLALGCTSK